MTEYRREAGLLLHPTSLPGPFGIGELGQSAFRFVDFLEAAGQKLWQVLPLGPTGYGDSPYASFSTFAGNSLLVSLETLERDGFLPSEALESIPTFDTCCVDYGKVQNWKIPLLERAARTFLKSAPAKSLSEFREFCERESFWLEDFALFMAVKEVFQKKAEAAGEWGRMWSNYWDLDIRLRKPEAVAAWKKKSSEAIDIHKVLQFWFFEQWTSLKDYANSKGIRIIGDIPIFVAPDSVDVWANRKLFHLDSKGGPLFVAGVPPDYFSETGQLWGNPLYNWPEHQKTGFEWWMSRIRSLLRFVDFIRIDHFRGFEAYWEIPFGSPNAVKGRWVKAPGVEFFTQVHKTLGDLPILAEDLGVITPEVEQMRDSFGFPGMKILQFAFDPADETGKNPFLPHNFIKNCIVYTGSHDNDTTLGWLQTLDAEVRHYVLSYVNGSEHEGAWALVRAALASTARVAILPAQDLLNLPSSGRMNTPSTLSGNWSWRLLEGQLSSEVSARLKETTKLYGR